MCGDHRQKYNESSATQEAFEHRGLRLAFQMNRIHIAGMILLFLILFVIGMLAAGMVAADDHSRKADKVIVGKSQRTLTLLAQGKVLRTYRVALGGSPIGAKEQQGDQKTPERHY